MAAVHWLTETGEMEPASVCAVDYSDEGEAVEFAHQLYRSVHGSACRRQGFVIADDGGDTLYTWRWTGGDPPETISVEDLAKSLAPRPAPSKSVTAHTGWVESAGQHALAVIEALRRGFASHASAASVRRLAPDRPVFRGRPKRVLARLVTLLRQSQAIWWTLTRWERSIDANGVSDAPHRAR